MTPKNIATAVTKDCARKGEIWRWDTEIWRWLQSTDWFEQKYQDFFAQAGLVEEVHQIIKHKKKSKKAAEKAAEDKREKEEQEIAKQLKFDL